MLMTVLIRNAVKPLLLTLSLLGLSAQALADTKVDDAWVRATVPGQPATGAFMHITSSTDSKLVDVASPVAKTVQIHQMSMKGDVMSMQRVTSVDLPAASRWCSMPTATTSCSWAWRRRSKWATRCH